MPQQRCSRQRSSTVSSVQLQKPHQQQTNVLLALFLCISHCINSISHCYNIGENFT